MGGAHLRAGMVAALALAIPTAGCGAAGDPYGATAWLRVEGGQFRPGEVPEVTPEGPSVNGILDLQSAVRRGEVGHPLSGVLAAGSTAVALFLDGDSGYWTLPAGVPDVTAPGQPTFAARLSWSLRTPLGPRALRVHAADSSGRHGPAAGDALVIGETAAPAGALVASLAWDAQADVDLRAVTPDKTEIWSRAPRDARSGGYLDQDSNAMCELDGARAEDIVWPMAPMAGRYLFRVDCASLCGVPATAWHLAVRREGAVVGQAQGQCVEALTRGSHDRGAGLVALEIDVP